MSQQSYLERYLSSLNQFPGPNPFSAAANVHVLVTWNSVTLIDESVGLVTPCVQVKISRLMIVSRHEAKKKQAVHNK